MGAVTEFNLRQLPSGEIERQALLDYVMSTDDRIERHFLEVKSDVDLNLKPGRGKVAKFILGAANRDPAVAEGYFEGHALMVLGATHGAADGIDGFEAKDLHRDVTAWIGTDGPRWGFDRVPLDNGRDVIVVDVWPPTGGVWACRADGDDETAARLRNGELYLRVEGETRVATGDEKHAMFARLREAPRKRADVSVAVAGCVRAAGVDVGVLEQAIVERAERMRDAATARSRSRISFQQDRRSHTDFQQEVDAWEESALIGPAVGLVAMAAAIHPGIQVEIRNGAKRFMQDVQVELKLDGSVFALWRGDDDEELPLFPNTPKPWGTDTLLSPIMMTRDLALLRAVRSSANRDRDRKVVIKEKRPAVLTIDMRALRPHEVFTTEPRKLALVMLVEDASEPPPEILCTYRVTASNMDDDVIHGEFMIPVEYHDWRDPIAELLTEDGT